MRVASLLAALCLLPLLTGWLAFGPARPWRDEAAGAAGALGFAALLVCFVLSGRFRSVSDAAGMDRTMRWHQLLGRSVAVALLLHPFLYTLPDGAPFARPDDVTHAASLGLGGLAIVSGMLAWLLLALLVLTAIRRDDLPFGYEAWRAVHGWLAALVALLGLHHALAAGRYAAEPAVAWLWVAGTAAALCTLVWVWLVRPLGFARRPWRIAAVRPAGLRSWELVLDPVGHDGLRYRAGQFAWLKLDRGPFARREHPFSIASAPSEGRALRFLIKEAGDFTRTIAALPVGARAYVDGPHGNLLADGRAEPGMAFLCGGVGVAPALSLIREEASRAKPRPMLLLYGNRVAEQILAGEELAALVARDALKVVHVLGEPPAGWAGETGVLDGACIARWCAGPAAAGWLFVLCGPPPMLRTARSALRALGVPAARILEERFAYG